MATELAPVLEFAPKRAAMRVAWPRLARWWSSTWPKLAAVALALAAWEAIVWIGWKPDHVLPGPMPVLTRLAQDMRSTDFDLGVAATLRRAFLGYAIAVGIGTVVGIAIARVVVLRRAIGSAILGLQSMPSIVWFPFALMWLGINETAIFFVVVLGAAPAVASGVLNGVDHVQPLLIRIGRVMGARGLLLYRHIILPAALPSFVGGLKLGWAFSWRSLMSAELIAVAGQRFSIGKQLQVAREGADMEQLLAVLVVILVIGVLIDGLFGAFGRAIRRRWGLGGEE